MTRCFPFSAIEKKHRSTGGAAINRWVVAALDCDECLSPDGCLQTAAMPRI